MSEVLIHEPRCNANCTPGNHHLSDGIGYPHLHRTDLANQCGECVPVTPPATEETA